MLEKRADFISLKKISESRIIILKNCLLWINEEQAFIIKTGLFDSEEIQDLEFKRERGDYLEFSLPEREFIVEIKVCDIKEIALVEEGEFMIRKD